MANIRLIKGRIKSAKNIAQITKAMELVAASKMKKAQSQALSGRLFAGKIYTVMMKLASKVDTRHHPLLSKPKKLCGRKLVVVISTNKGLCGGLNTNLFRFLYREYGPVISSVDFITVGQKGADFVTRIKGKILADFSQTVPFIKVASAIGDFVINHYVSNQADSVDLIFSDFLSAIRQEPKKKTILPLGIESAGDLTEDRLLNTKFEPSVYEVFNSLLPLYLENQIRDAIYEAEASEHSARMLAMRNATDNAESLTQDLTLVYNKARQEKITYEITDMVTARLATE